MKTSARNALRGVVSKVREGAVNSEVTLKVGDVDIVAVVTRDAVEELGLKPGAGAVALIKSSFVILAAGSAPLKTSARNSIPGVIVGHEVGAINDKVVVEFAPGAMITAIVTRESAEELRLEPGAAVQALIKAPHVILAVE
jgi:molybdate transport system regulatory protein